MPCVFDCVLIGAEPELDLLEARFRELDDIPEVTHVIVEAPVTHQGEPKPLHFWENARGQPENRFDPWDGRWTSVRVEPHELPADADPAARKNALRDYLAHGFSGDPDDIILHGGIDEIPAGWAVRRLAAGQVPLPVTLSMRWCAYTARQVHPLPWHGTAAQARRDMTSFTALRQDRRGFPLIVTAGTRLSMMGAGPGHARHPDGHVLRDVQPDETWPRAVREGLCPESWLAA